MAQEFKLLPLRNASNLGTPNRVSRWYKSAKPFSYGMLEKASSGSIDPDCLITNLVNSCVSPKSSTSSIKSFLRYSFSITVSFEKAFKLGNAKKRLEVVKKREAFFVGNSGERIVWVNGAVIFNHQFCVLMLCSQSVYRFDKPFSWFSPLEINKDYPESKGIKKSVPFLSSHQSPGILQLVYCKFSQRSFARRKLCVLR